VRYFVAVKTQFTSFHNWPDAPDDVGFLRSTHRHVFHICLQVQVHSASREVEFFQLQRWLEAQIKRQYGGDIGSTSCETIAGRILEAAAADGYSPHCCDVLEDNENGAIVYYAD